MPNKNDFMLYVLRSMSLYKMFSVIFVDNTLVLKFLPAREHYACCKQFNVTCWLFENFWAIILFNDRFAVQYLTTQFTLLASKIAWSLPERLLLGAIYRKVCLWAYISNYINRNENAHNNSRKKRGQRHVRKNLGWIYRNWTYWAPLILIVEKKT